MAGTAECAATAEMKMLITSPRVEIDTSPPFESVKEAVERFGGSGPWIPHHLLRLAATHHENDALDMEKIEEEALQLERDLIIREQQTLDVLKELESAKRFVQDLKFNSIPEMSSFMVSPALNPESHANCPVISPSLMFSELTQAKLNLNKTSIDLATIQASVESLNKTIRRDKTMLLHENHHLSKIEAVEVNQVNFEADQCKKMTEASRYEVMKAMAEIEKTKNCIRMAEMRLNAAKKMEEAAKAIEAIAVVNGEDSSDGITLSFEEYKALSQKAKQAEDLCIDTNVLDQVEVPMIEKFEEKTTTEGNVTKFKFRNSHVGDRNDTPGFRSTASIGEVLSRKFVVQDDVMMGRSVENHSERGRVSLSQMLREQSRVILEQSNGRAEKKGEKHFFMKRKKFGFIQVPIPTKSSKKKAQPVNMR